ncbi:MAG: protein-disulfide reductase DsbD domain-containing protein, partial [Planctomycetota bacterium]
MPVFSPHRLAATALTVSLLALFLLVAGALPAMDPASDQATDLKVVRTAEDSPVVVTGHGVAGVRPGERFELLLEARIERGWHIYGMKMSPDLGDPTSLTVVDIGPFRLAGEVKEPKPHPRRDETTGGVLLEHEGKVSFRVPLEAPPGIPDGRSIVKLRFTYQACDANVCLLAVELDLPLPVIVGAAASGAAAGTGTGEEGSGEASRAGGVAKAPVSFEARLDRARVRAGERLVAEFSGEVVSPGIMMGEGVRAA